MTPDAAMAVAEWDRRHGVGEISDPIGALLSPEFVHAKQRDFLLDESRRKSLLSGRRNGKSYGFARQCFLMALRLPGSSSLFVGLTRPSAKEIIWGELQNLVHRLGLPATVNHTDLRITLSNGSTIRVAGCADTADQDRFRGTANDLVILDEVQGWPSWLQAFVEQVIEPTLIDRNGTLCLAGTPNDRLFGYFFDVTKGGKHPQYSQHHFTLFDNTFFGRPSPTVPWSPAQAHARALEELERAKSERGLSETHPIYVSEYLGEWPTQVSNLLYDDFSERNIVQQPPIGWERGFMKLGLDLGFKDHCGFVHTSQDIVTQRLTYLESWSKPGLVLSDIAAALQPYVEKWPDLSIVVDEAGLGKTVAESLATSYGLPIHAAVKTDKRLGIALLNSDLRLGNVTVVEPRCQGLVKQFRSVQWDAKRQREMEGQVCDLADAALYAYRSYVIGNQPLPVKKIDTRDDGTKYWAARMAEISQTKADNDTWRDLD